MTKRNCYVISVPSVMVVNAGNLIDEVQNDSNEDVFFFFFRRMLRIP